LSLLQKHSDTPTQSTAVLIKVFRRVERKGGRISADCDESPAESTTTKK